VPGSASRKRSKAGIVMTASPSQFTPRTKSRRGGGRGQGDEAGMVGFSIR